MPTYMNTNEHQPTPEEVEVYSAAIMEGLQASVSLVADEASIAAKIGTIRPLGEDGKIPREVVFDMQGPSGQASKPGFKPLIRSLVRPFRVKYIISRQDFYKNLGDTLTAVPRVLVRSTMLLMKNIFARLLRSGDILPPGHAGRPAFFAVDKFEATGNLHHNTFLTRAAVDAGIDEMATRGIVADTLIVPPALYGAAVQSVEMNNHVFSGEDGAVVTHSEPSRIKQIIRLPELDNGAAVTKGTWYLASCLGPNGPRALYGADDKGFEFLTNLGNPYSISDNIIWMAERHTAFAYGDAAYINRYEQGEPSAPHPDDIAWLDKIVYPGFLTERVLSDLAAADLLAQTVPVFEDEVVFHKPDEAAAAVPHTKNLIELITKMAAMKGLDADKIAARLEKAHAS